VSHGMPFRPDVSRNRRRFPTWPYRCAEPRHHQFVVRVMHDDRPALQDRQPQCRAHGIGERLRICRKLVRSEAVTGAAGNHEVPTAAGRCWLPHEGAEHNMRRIAGVAKDMISSALNQAAEVVGQVIAAHGWWPG